MFWPGTQQRNPLRASTSSPFRRTYAISDALGPYTSPSTRPKRNAWKLCFPQQHTTIVSASRFCAKVKNSYFRNRSEWRMACVCISHSLIASFDVDTVYYFCLFISFLNDSHRAPLHCFNCKITVGTGMNCFRIVRGGF